MAEGHNPDAAPLLTELYSPHMELLTEVMGTVDLKDKEAMVKAHIEVSKPYWSELTTYFTAVEGPATASSSTSLLEKTTWSAEEGTPEWYLEVAQDNKEVFRSLQEQHPGGFFHDEDDLGPDHVLKVPRWMLDKEDGKSLMEIRLSSETPFAEGAQAQLFHAHMIENDGGENGEFYVMKVFKEGTSLRLLQTLLPPTMLTNDKIRTDGLFMAGPSCNAIFGARLLKSGRFAFIMMRAWGDLRNLLDVRMFHFKKQGPPFPSNIAISVMLQIARGMRDLHERGIIHRDLKAANILIVVKNHDGDLDPILLKPYIRCWVADYECSVGVVGTRFWRAPEILRGVKDRSISQRPELFTKQSDVYSFGMTCYEILSGGIPLEEVKINDYDVVIGGMRPTLPSQTTPWMMELVYSCWHNDPSMRPTFEKIVEILKPYADRSYPYYSSLKKMKVNQEQMKVKQMKG